MDRELPKGWIEIKLGEILKLKNGYAFKSKDFSEFGIPVLKISNIKDKLVSTDESVKVPDYLLNENFIVQKGDVLVAMSGATTGKYGIYTSDEIALQNQRVGNLKPLSELIQKKFIYYLLGSLKKTIEERAYGAAQPNISATMIEGLDILLPPLNAQKRIVAKLDALFGHLDSLNNRLERVPELLKNFRQQVLTQAVTGKLTEEWRKGKGFKEWPSKVNEIILNRIEQYKISLADSKKNNKPKPKKPEFLSYKSDELVSHEISGWVKGPVGILCDSIVPGRDKPKSFSGDIPWITMPAIKRNRVIWDDAELYLSLEEIKEVKAKIIPKDSVIISIVGRFGIAAILDTEAVINQQLHAFLPSPLILPQFLMYQIRTSENYMNEISTSTTVAYINKTKANSIPVAIPHIDEQTEIVKRVEELFDFADRIESKYQSLKEKIDQLPQSILNKAFKGELVPQDSNDEPASVLLERIKEEKEK